MQVTWSSAAKRALHRLPEKVGTAVIEFVYGPLSQDPRRVGMPLRSEFSGLHVARRGDFRIIYRIATDELWISSIEHRSDVYRTH